MKTAESQVVVTYGPAKKGKTTDLGFTFPLGVFFAPSASSLKPLKGVVGITPKTAIVKDLDPVHQFIVKHANDESISAIIIDDVALLADESVKAWKAASPGWYAYQKIIEVCQEICVIARQSPWHLVLDSHERQPAVDEQSGQFVQGGPILPGRKAGPAIEKNASLILHAMMADGMESDGASDEAWPVIYECDPANKSYITGDRNGFALKHNPMNLREILKAGGIDLPRVHEWQEEMVEKLCAYALAGKLDEGTLAAAEKHMAAKWKADQVAVDWTLRDARARVFMKLNSQHRSTKIRGGLLAANRSL